LGKPRRRQAEAVVISGGGEGDVGRERWDQEFMAVGDGTSTGGD
jgi:hypothetical protein